MKFSVSIDFNDDMWKAESDWSPARLRDSIAMLASRGITDIRWVDHGSFADGLYDQGSGFDKLGCATRTREAMPDPRQVVIDAAHELGLTVTQVLKPWDLAFGSPSLLFPHGKGPQPPVGLPEIGGHGGASHNWLREHPESLVRIHPSLIDLADARQPITTIRFWHEHSVPAEAPQLRVFVSHDNYTYEPYDGPMTVTHDVRKRQPPVYAPAPESRVGAQGDFACVELSGMSIDAPYIAVEPASPLAIENTLAALVELEDADGKTAPFTYGLTPLQPNGKAVNWKQGGIAYDCARQTQLLRVLMHASSAGRMRINMAEQKMIAFARGRNESKGGHVEFADPQARDWLTGLVEEALDAGVDGVDIRFGSHTECLDYENYGFHPAIIDQYQAKYGLDITSEPFDRAKWRDLRGDYVDQWLHEVSKLVRSRNKKMMVHLTDFMQGDASQRCAYEIAWHWKKWLESGLVDVATFKAFDPAGGFYRDALEICRRNNLPMIWERKPSGSDKQFGWIDAITQAKADGFDQFDLYELAVFQTLREDGRIDIGIPYIWQKIAAMSE